MLKFLKNNVLEFNTIQIKENIKMKTIKNTILRKQAISTPKRIQWIDPSNIRQPQTNSPRQWFRNLIQKKRPKNNKSFNYY